MSLDFIIYGLLSLIPPLLITVLVLVTKSIKKSFLFGALASLLILPITFGVVDLTDGFIVSFNGFNLTSYIDNIYLGIKTIFNEIFSIFFSDGGLFGFLNEWNMSIIFFLFALGVMTSFMVLSG